MGEDERYSRIEIDLTVARADEEIFIEGDYISVATCSGVTDEYFKLNHRNARPIYPNEVKSVKLTHGFKKIWLTNSATAGLQTKLVLYVGNKIVVQVRE